MATYAHNEEITLIVTRDEPNFDRACDNAMMQACMRFGVDDCGHINNVPGSERSRDSIELAFESYSASGGMLGWSHTYIFTAKVVNNE